MARCPTCNPKSALPKTCIRFKCSELELHGPETPSNSAPAPKLPRVARCAAVRGDAEPADESEH
eukprot:15485361-Alexandrium_andersonii.AAC.2